MSEAAAAMLEGSRTFDIAFGLITGLACLGTAAPILWWSLPAHRRWFFDRRLDGRGNLQMGYGLFGMAMFGTDMGCRFIDHGALEFVHPTFFAITVIYVAALLPRVIALALAPRPAPMTVT